MSNNVSGKIFTMLVLAGIVIVIVCSISVDVPLFKRYQRAKEQRSELHGQNARLREKLAELRLNQERFRTDSEFVERLARKNRLLRPGEVVFVFDTPEDEKK